MNTQTPQPLHSSARVRTSTPLLDALRPLVPLFHPFLDDADAARLLRTSRTTALALLPGYTFSTHIFQPAYLASLLRLRELCLAYRLRIALLCLPNLRDLTFDATPPHLSPIPASVTALSFGQAELDFEAFAPGWVALSAAAGAWQDREP